VGNNGKYDKAQLNWQQWRWKGLWKGSEKVEVERKKEKKKKKKKESWISK